LIGLTKSDNDLFTSLMDGGLIDEGLFTKFVTALDADVIILGAFTALFAGFILINDNGPALDDGFTFFERFNRFGRFISILLYITAYHFTLSLL
jgi:hypothetical protein